MSGRREQGVPDLASVRKRVTDKPAMRGLSLTCYGVSRHAESSQSRAYGGSAAAQRSGAAPARNNTAATAVGLTPALTLQLPPGGALAASACWSPVLPICVRVDRTSRFALIRRCAGQSGALGRCRRWPPQVLSGAASGWRDGCVRLRLRAAGQCDVERAHQGGPARRPGHAGGAAQWGRSETGLWSRCSLCAYVP